VRQAGRLGGLRSGAAVISTPMLRPIFAPHTYPACLPALMLYLLACLLYLAPAAPLPYKASFAGKSHLRMLLISAPTMA